MLESLTEYIANRTVRVAYADLSFHNFVVVWNGNVLNVVWDNHKNEISSVDGITKNFLLEDRFSEKDLKKLEFILHNHLTIK